MLAVSVAATVSVYVTANAANANFKKPLSSEHNEPIRKQSAQTLLSTSDE